MKRLSSSIRLSLLAFVASAALTSTANASLLLEPYAGYYTGKWTVSANDTNQSGIVYGGRVGVQHLGLMAGLDFMSGNWSDKSSPTITTTPGDLGLFVGYNFPVLLRVYGVYGFSAKRDLSSSAGTDTAKGTEIKLGVGYSGLPFVSINLEYLTSTFTAKNAGTLANNQTESMYGLTVSLPFTFM